MSSLLMYRSLIVFVVIVCQTLFLNALDTDQTSSCPTGCECTELGKLVCTGLTEFPILENKSLIHSLTINDHEIKELKGENLSGFTHLEQLDVSKGLIEQIEAGTFDAVKETIVRINLENNKLSDIGAQIFHSLDHVNEILLGSNHLNKIGEDVFVNLPELVTLKVNANHIDTVTTGAFKDLPKLENLNFNLNYLTDIPVGPLSQLSSLKELVLSFNQIHTIADSYELLLPKLESIQLDSNPVSTMTSFPKISNSLKSLDLQFTHLTGISKDAWKNVASIDTLFLSGTMLTSIQEGMFTGLVNLSKLYLRDMPVLKVIGPNAFKGLTKLHSFDVASSDMLTAIDENAFQSNSNLTSFFAYDCKLKHIPEKLLPWNKMRTVMVKDNPIRCDCTIKWMFSKTAFGNNSDVKASFDKLKCDSPIVLKYSLVTKVHPDRLVCVESDHVKRLATGVIVVICCAVFIITFALIMKFRKRIIISCRKYYQYRRYQNDAVFTVEHDTSVAELEDTDFADGKPLKDMRLEM